MSTKNSNTEKSCTIDSVNHCFITHTSINRWGGCIIIMEKEGKGIVRLYWYKDDKAKAYIEMLSVTPEFRKHKIGTKLMNEAEKIARELKYNTCYLWVRWARDYTWLHDWYIKSGYLDIKDHETEKDSVWMQKTI